MLPPELIECRRQERAAVNDCNPLAQRPAFHWFTKASCDGTRLEPVLPFGNDGEVFVELHLVPILIAAACTPDLVSFAFRLKP